MLNSILLIALYSVSAMAFSTPHVLTELVSNHGGTLLNSVSHQLTALHSPATIPQLAWTKAVTPHSLLQIYTNALKAHPLVTKMLTGGALATCGDAIAQKSAHANEQQKTEKNEEKLEYHYDKRRAVSFAVFDMAYRALQHVSFPIIVQLCQGQFLMTLVQNLPDVSAQSFLSDGHVLAALEQTLASQLGIVPFIYYPVFFALTGVLQGLTSEQAVLRATENFVPLMKRNLIFWIPVQFVQFGYVPQDLQIPFLSLCGLIWTFILSAFAGSTKGYQSAQSRNGEELIPEMHDDLDQILAIIHEEKQRNVLVVDINDDVKELTPR